MVPSPLSEEIHGEAAEPVGKQHEMFGMLQYKSCSLAAANYFDKWQ